MKQMVKWGCLTQDQLGKVNLFKKSLKCQGCGEVYLLWNFPHKDKNTRIVHNYMKALIVQQVNH